MMPGQVFWRGPRTRGTGHQLPASGVRRGPGTLRYILSTRDAVPRFLQCRHSRMRTSMAQAFTAAGDGYVLRGDTFEWEEGGRSPHLDKKLAASLLRDVIELYRKQNRGSLPSRLVV